MSKNLIVAGFSVIGYDAAARCRNLCRAGLAGRASVAEGGIGRRYPDHIAAVVRGAVRCGAGAEGIAARRPRGSRNQHLHPGRQDEPRSRNWPRLDRSALDCPLSGSGSQALERDVLVYGSGPKEAYDRCLPVFEGFRACAALSRAVRQWLETSSASPT